MVADEWGHADVVFAINVLAHVPDPNEIAAGISVVLTESGVAHIEVPSLVRMIESCAFDTIYHEHHGYFSLTALAELLGRHGLAIRRANTRDLALLKSILEARTRREEQAAAASRR